jgi:soluble lytic murein transglycosylase-like protein
LGGEAFGLAAQSSTRARFGRGKPTAMISARNLVATGLLAAVLAMATPAQAGQVEEPLSASVATLLSQAVADAPIPVRYAARDDVIRWMARVSHRLARKIADDYHRIEFLSTLHYEAIRAGLDPDLVLGVVAHESDFRKYAISIAGARGYMQIMPFWQRLIGSPEQNLFHLRTNLRYGCTILRHYLDIENGDLVRALGRYNGSLGKMEYPQAVFAARDRFTGLLR